MKFLIETKDGHIRHDFSFHLREAIEYQNWFYREHVHEYRLSDEVVHEEGWIPIGGLPFVMAYMEQTGLKKRETVRPINLPKELRKERYLKRNVEYQKGSDDLYWQGEKFVKSNTTYKKFTEIIRPYVVLDEDEYLISDVVELESEWRTFVYKGELKGLQQYSGDLGRYPSLTLIKAMIEDYTDAPEAYTLDVGVNKEGTLLIEVHPFVSCGLYGFQDYRILPQMFAKGFAYFSQS